MRPLEPITALLSVIALCVLYGFLLRRTGASWLTVVVLVSINQIFICGVWVPGSMPGSMEFPANLGAVLILGTICYVACLPWNRRVALPTLAVILTVIGAAAGLVYLGTGELSRVVVAVSIAVIAFGLTYLINIPSQPEIVFLEPEPEAGRADQDRSRSAR